MKKVNREWRYRSHIHHLVPAQPGTIAICVLESEGDKITATVERDVPAWGVFDIIADIYEGDRLVEKEHEKKREAGPLVFVDTDVEKGLVPSVIVPGLLRIERNGVPITDRVHHTPRIINPSEVVFADQPIEPSPAKPANIAVRCDVCQSDLLDWHGNLMVDANTYGKRIDWLKVICKPCTGRLDASGQGRSFHSIYELIRVRETPLYVLRFALIEQHDKVKWSLDAIKTLLGLIARANPTIDPEFLEAFVVAEKIAEKKRAIRDPISHPAISRDGSHMTVDLKKGPITPRLLAELLRSGDDSVHNQVRVRKDGVVFLSQDMAPPPKGSNVLFRFETFDPGNNYVGGHIEETDVDVVAMAAAINKNWPEPSAAYIDQW